MKKNQPASVATLRAALKEIYAEVDARIGVRNCTKCAKCCQFGGKTGTSPSLTSAEARVTAQAWKAAGRRFREHADGSCPCLDSQGRCMIYAERPFGCRSHFCEEAGGTPARRDVADLIRRMEDLDSSLPSPRPLVAAIKNVLHP